MDGWMQTMGWEQSRWNAILCGSLVSICGVCLLVGGWCNQKTVLHLVPKVKEALLRFVLLRGPARCLWTWWWVVHFAWQIQYYIKYVCVWFGFFSFSCSPFSIYQICAMLSHLWWNINKNQIENWASFCLVTMLKVHVCQFLNWICRSTPLSSIECGVLQSPSNTSLYGVCSLV